MRRGSGRGARASSIAADTRDNAAPCCWRDAVHGLGEVACHSGLVAALGSLSQALGRALRPRI
eukprot:11187651-Lingulodinium_polyedra.AAC.1